MAISYLLFLETFDSFQKSWTHSNKLQTSESEAMCPVFFLHISLGDMASLVYLSLSSFCHTCLYCIIATTITIIFIYSHVDQ